MISLKKIDSENEISSELLKALWNAHKGEWNRAHEIVQKHEGHQEYDRIHAYLHRVEGDRYNAGWWYKRIGIKYPSESLEKEWDSLVQQFS